MKQYQFTINGKPYSVTIDSVADGKASVTVNGASYQVELPADAAPAAVSAPAPAAAPAQTAQPAAAPAPAAASAPAVSGPGSDVVAPMPGVIIEVSVREGQAVKRGEKVAVLEAMKMENELLAERDGTVTRIYVHKGDSVADGAKIVTLA